MWCPPKTRSALALRRLGAYALAQMSAVPGLAEIVELFRAVQNSLEAKRVDFESALDALIAVTALRDRARKVLIKAISTAAHKIRQVGGGRFNSRLYQAYFPDGLKHKLNRSISENIVQARDMLTRLESEQDPLLRELTPLLTTALQEAEDSLRQYDEAVAAVRRARAQLDSEKLVWIDGYRATHSRLRLYYVSNPDLAEEFFRANPRDIRNNEEPGEPAQTQTGATPVAAASAEPTAQPGGAADELSAAA